MFFIMFRLELDRKTHNTSIGLSATVSFPLDGKAQALCKQAAENHNAFREQVLANKRLDFEIARLKNCGTHAEGYHVPP